ncbi:hypothetical protein ACX8Z9_04600 [Arthrobacter halodurans]|uniref:Uncharacterized protein n=1 Tax=Arthrobacter halodurans TaxID=516699 RepID=A0ABV4UTV2_9MICC
MGKLKQHLAASLTAAAIVLSGIPAAHAQTTGAPAQDTAVSSEPVAPYVGGAAGLPASVVPGIPFEFDITAAGEGIASLKFVVNETLQNKNQWYYGVSYPSDTVDNGDGTATRRVRFYVPRDTLYGTYPLGQVLVNDGKPGAWVVPANAELVVDDPAHPVANTVAVAGLAAVGEHLTGSLDAPGATVAYEWTAKREEPSIAGNPWRIPFAYHWQHAAVKATATWPDGTVRVRRGRSGDIGSFPLTVAAPTLGVPRVGAPVEALHEVLGPEWGQMAGHRYEWLRAGVPIAGAVSKTYVPTLGDLGKPLQVRVTSDGWVWRKAVTLDSPARTVQLGALPARVPAIAGTARVAVRLTAAPGTWTSRTSFAYQWTRDGKAIAGATGKTYVPVPADRGRSVAVKVTGTAPGYAPRTVASKAVRPGYGILGTSWASIRGTLRAGGVATATTGTWTAGTKLTYRWMRNGKTIPGAASRSYRVSRADTGQRITVRITGTKTGYAVATRTSAAVRPR